MFPLCAHQETATRELSLLKTKKPHPEFKMALESVKSDLEMTTGELQKQMMEVAEIQPSDPGIFKEVFCHIAYTSSFFHYHYRICHKRFRRRFVNGPPQTLCVHV